MNGRKRLIEVQLDILNEVKRVCDENNIHFFLDYGTLIGAVRHKGMIPWDDDIDLGMLREDYERFCTIIEEKLRKEFYFQSWNNDENYACPFSKVRKHNTHFVEQASGVTGQKDGIFVDIFPYDNYPSVKWKQLFQKYNLKIIEKLLYAKCGYILWDDKKKNIKKYVYGGLRYISKFFPKDILCKWHKKIATMENKRNALYYIAQGGDGQYERYKVPKKCLESGYVELEFENGMYPCPGDYDTWLKCFYGDYMKLPPENERKSIHNVKKIVIDGEEIKA